MWIPGSDKDSYSRLSGYHDLRYYILKLDITKQAKIYAEDTAPGAGRFRDETRWASDRARHAVCTSPAIEAPEKGAYN